MVRRAKQYSDLAITYLSIPPGQLTTIAHLNAAWRNAEKTTEPRLDMFWRSRLPTCPSAKRPPGLRLAGVRFDSNDWCPVRCRERLRQPPYVALPWSGCP
eukprot:4996946-Pyramimonas_sp.AAC.1